MPWLDKLTNPLWHRVDQLDHDHKDDLCMIICQAGFVRVAADESLVKPFERLCNVSSEKAVRPRGRKLVPFEATVRQRLVDEAAVALLNSCRRSNLPGGVLKYIVPSDLPDAIGPLILAGMNDRLRRQGPDTLAASGYSQDPDEARVQLLLSWAKLLDVPDPTFASMVSAAFFEREWASLTSTWLSGCLKGMSSVEKSSLYKRCRTDCLAMSAHQELIVKYLVDQMRARTSRK